MSGCVIENGKGDPLLSFSIVSLYLLILFPLPLLQLQLVGCSVENGKNDPLLSLLTHSLPSPVSPAPACWLFHWKRQRQPSPFSLLPVLTHSLPSPASPAPACGLFRWEWQRRPSPFSTYSFSSLSRFSSSSLSANLLRMAKTTLSFLSLWSILIHSLPSPDSSAPAYRLFCWEWQRRPSLFLSLVCTYSFSSLSRFSSSSLLAVQLNCKDDLLEAVDLLTLYTTASKSELTRYIINWRIFVYILSVY